MASEQIVGTGLEFEFHVEEGQLDRLFTLKLGVLDTSLLSGS